jgi:hypothetical protein
LTRPCAKAATRSCDHGGSATRAQRQPVREHMQGRLYAFCCMPFGVSRLALSAPGTLVTSMLYRDRAL